MSNCKIVLFFSLAFLDVTLHIAAVFLIGEWKALQLVQFSLALLDAALFLYKFILSLNKILPFILKKKKKDIVGHAIVEEQGKGIEIADLFASLKQSNVYLN